MAPRPSSASIGYFPSCAVATSARQVCRRDRPLPPLLASPLDENPQGQVERNAPVGLVDDLADLQVAGEAAKDVRVLAAELLLLGQPADRVPDRVLRALHQVRTQRRDRVVPPTIALRLESARWCDEVVAPWAHVSTLDH